MLAKVQHHALGPRAGAGGEQDHRIVVRSRIGLRLGGRRAREFGEESVAGGRVPTPEPHGWRWKRASDKVVESEPVLMEYEIWPEPREDVVELIAVHLDMDRADRRAVADHAEIAEEMLDRIVGKQRHSVVASEPAVAQQSAIRLVNSCNSP